ncbi:trypsin-like peptidase domain-containing protein [Actinomadura sp. DC4]|uniref:S1C family serine protease n=1 Tax=Actinomadura sp. DC4 TaxID=3055069 RepID=UPI0025B1CE5B|nr:trypsin-like peptidase domain-containing protein [Actinomadura sp. DC4]MDN3353295.1 trypsin-like peptidase domain-containing protein [Actinomadura sp. DC4]
MKRQMRPAAALAGALIVGLPPTAGCGNGVRRDNTPTTASAGTGSPGSAAALEQQFEQVVKTVLPSVVQINTDSGLGSGVVYDTKGDIVTNDHVVAGAHRLQVTTPSSKSPLPARLVGEFAANDLAVVRVKDARLTPATFGDSSRLAVGQLVMAMGNPLGLSGSVTNGIVSALGRTVSSQREGSFPGATIAGAVQTSAPINPGNSGGALVTLSNQVVGIPTLTVSDPQIGGAAAGIGFAIPSNTVKLIAAQLIASGRVKESGRAAMGVKVRTVVDMQGNVAGVGVVSVTTGGPADKAGVKADDVIVSVGGVRTSTTTALAEALAGLKPGQRVQVELQHPNGSKNTVTVTLNQLPG